MRSFLRYLEEAKGASQKDPLSFAEEHVAMFENDIEDTYDIKRNGLPAKLWHDLQVVMAGLAEEAAKLAGGGEAEVDFDLTAFKPGAWEKLTKRHGITGGERSKRSLGGTLAGSFHNFFLWTGDGITVETNNNPVTGEFSTPGGRAPDKGYASYVNVKGRPDKVKKFVADFRKTADYIKGEKND